MGVCQSLREGRGRMFWMEAKAGMATLRWGRTYGVEKLKTGQC